MEFEWDEAKDAANRAKHGLSLADAVRLDWDNGTEETDRRADYGEDRFRMIANIAARLHVCVYAVRGDRIRVISLRKANRREVRRYEQGRG